MLSSFFSSIRWQDVVDILLNSYLLFRLYVLFRGTNVFRVITGIAILWFFQRMAFALGLIVTSWVMQGIAAVAALIIIIVFRNEIRSVLHAKNLRAILWSFPHKMANTPIEILADSIFELARRGFGALIVLPGKEDLREYVRGGIPWHGLISKEMIISIFWHDNPVHDGAAIIQGNKITEVGVILPLSNREDLPSFYREALPSFYGTRHRAAVGLAEITDALIVVVSEERGDVAVAQDSVIKDIRDKNNLIKLLQAHIGISAEITKYPKKEKIEIGAAALASFLFITGVWFSFSQGLDTMTTLEIPIEYMKRDPGMEILDTSVDAVSLQLGGSGALIKSIRPEQVQIRLDLSKAVVGKNTFTITHKNITLPPGIFLKKVQPPVVETTLDTHIKKRLHVQVDWVGRLPDHRTLLDVKIDPEKVLVIGGKRILEKISTIYTEKVPLDNITESGVITVNMILNPVSLKIDSSSKDKITVKYTVK
ncbi:MAG: DNA integrity scanning protein DisA nucleotide-binding domain protein [Deltaproteobacteria bacterium]|nr:DNA integrity scanning protein DisA nucleotide-binding domain protein [Deltaproteobacteria bacterium]